MYIFTSFISSHSATLHSDICFHSLMENYFSPAFLRVEYL
ncbi:hypothetical protein LTSEJOH_2205 [Salmonella enterica subsp. enterica serovar Johannesburg str. S5-703]|nr:hypothetical protein LTSEJOH_2205 [Salmonella enterica subsp. enterica serovar Johannesburg str. S5-703]